MPELLIVFRNIRMNVILKSFGQSVAFCMVDAALSILFEHQIIYKDKLIDFVIFFAVILLFNIISPRLRQSLGFESKSDKAQEK